MLSKDLLDFWKTTLKNSHMTGLSKNVYFDVLMMLLINTVTQAIKWNL